MEETIEKTSRWWENDIIAGAAGIYKSIAHLFGRKTYIFRYDTKNGIEETPSTDVE